MSKSTYKMAVKNVFRILVSFCLISILAFQVHSFPGDKGKSIEKKASANSISPDSTLKKDETKRQDKSNGTDKPVEEMSVTTTPSDSGDNSEADSNSKSKNKDRTQWFDSEKSQKCPGISCSIPSKDSSTICKVSTNTKINPVLPMMGSKGDCCPVHVCSRADGTSFTHYGMEGEGYSGSSLSYQQGMDINEIPSLYPPNFPSFPQFPFYSQPQPLPQTQNQQQQFGNFLNNQQQYGGVGAMQSLMTPFYSPGPTNNRISRNAQFAPPQAQAQQAFAPNNWDMFGYNRARRNAMPQPQFARPAGVFEQYGQQNQQQMHQ